MPTRYVPAPNGVKELQVLFVNVDAKAIGSVDSRRVHIIDMDRDEQQIIESFLMSQIGSPSGKTSKVFESLLSIVGAILTDREGEVVPKAFVSRRKTREDAPFKLPWPVPVDFFHLVSHVEVSLGCANENSTENDRLSPPLLHLGPEVVQVAEPLPFVSMGRQHRLVLQANADATQVWRIRRAVYLANE